jgi:hypothetical protein
MVRALALGEPSWERFTDGRFDAVPLLLAAVILVLMKLLLGVRMRWQVILGTVLAAPLLVGLSHHISYPLTVALLMLTVGVVSFVARHGGPPGGHPT